MSLECMQLTWPSMGGKHSRRFLICAVSASYWRFYHSKPRQIQQGSGAEFSSTHRRFLLRLHNQEKSGPSRIQLREQPLHIPLVGAQNGKLQIGPLKDFLDLDIVSLPGAAKDPRLLDDTLWELDRWNGRWCYYICWLFLFSRRLSGKRWTWLST